MSSRDRVSAIYVIVRLVAGCLLIRAPPSRRQSLQKMASCCLRFFLRLYPSAVELAVKPSADRCASQYHEIIVLARLA